MSNSLLPHRLDLCPRDSPGKNTRVGYHSLLQGIFPTQGWTSGLLHCRQILYHLSHREGVGWGGTQCEGDPGRSQEELSVDWARRPLGEVLLGRTVFIRIMK